MFRSNVSLCLVMLRCGIQDLPVVVLNAETLMLKTLVMPQGMGHQLPMKMNNTGRGQGCFGEWATWAQTQRRSCDSNGTLLRIHDSFKAVSVSVYEYDQSSQNQLSTSKSSLWHWRCRPFLQNSLRGSGGSFSGWACLHLKSDRS